MENKTRQEFLNELGWRPPQPIIWPKGGVAGNINKVKRENIRNRQPIIIWINPDPQGNEPADPWKELEWGTDEPLVFAQALIPYFNDISIPEPRQGDLIGGIDKNDQLVVLRISIPINDPQNKFEQKEVPVLERPE
jgi:hypothetical protein